MKLLIQLEIEYEDSIIKEDYVNLIKKVKTHFEEKIYITETENIKFKSLGKVRISRVIQ